MIKKLFILLVFAASFFTIFADEPNTEVGNTQGKGTSHRAPKRQRPTAVTVKFEEGFLCITSLLEVGDVTITITDEQTSGQTEYFANFSTSVSEWTLELPNGEYSIIVEGGSFAYTYYFALESTE